MTQGVDLTLVSAALEQLLKRSGRQAVYDCRATQQRVVFTPESAAASDGLLPAFLVAADAVWREATGKGFSIEVRPQQRSVFGFAVVGVRAGTFATIALAMLEVIEAIPDGEILLVNDLASFWQQTEDRITRASQVEFLP